MPERGNLGSRGTGPGPRFKPRSQRSIRYYKASLVLGGIFVTIAMTLPIWIEWVRHPTDNGPAGEEIPVGAIGTPAAATPGSRQLPGQPPPPSVNVGCRAYVFARCNALNIPPASCAPAIETSMGVPVGSAMDVCRAAVEMELRTAAKEAGTLASAETPGAIAPVADAVAPGEQAAALAAAGGAAARDAYTDPGRDPGVDPGSAAAGATAKPDVPPLPPAERAARLQRMHELVMEIQHAQYTKDYVMTPAAQQARLEEIRRIAEQDGSPEAREIYNALARQRLPSGPLKAEEPTATSVQPSPERTAGTTPEMEAAAKLAADANRKAGLPVPPPPPSAMPAAPVAPPTGSSLAPMDPSSAIAPPAQNP